MPLIESLESRRLMFGTHVAITVEPLCFLNDATLSTVNAQHNYEDLTNANVPADHFDGSFFTEGAARINGHYRNALGNASPSSFNSAAVATEFGRLLHAVQDFYAHSNWVELGETGLIDDSLGFWNALKPYAIHRGAMLVEGESLHPSIPGYGTATFSRSGASHVAKVSFPNGVVMPAVFSGAFGGHDNTPNSIGMDHALLNKDYPNISGYAEAASMAVRQTRQEFRRLGALIRARYGDAGVNKLLQQWVKPDATSQAQARAVLNGTGIPAPTDDNSLGNARNLGTLPAGSNRSFNDFVGGADTQDFYRFTIATTTATLTIRLTGLRNDADLRLLSSDGSTTVVKSSKSGTSSELIARVVPSDVYFLRVYQFTGDTNYSLSLSVAPAPPPETTANAQVLGTLKVDSTTTINNFVGLTDPQDFFRFTLSAKTSFSARLTGLSADADLVLVDASGNTLVKSANADTVDELITRTLNAGTYYLRVYQYSGSTNYRLTLVIGSAA